MSKKEILVTLAILVVIVGGAVGGFVVWNHYDTWKKSQQNNQSAQTTPANQDISLQKSTTNASSSSNLSVDTSANNSNPAQLGSGIASSSKGGASSSNGSNVSAPDPSQFGQYEQYKDATEALYGDIKVGTGNEVKAGTKVSVLYKGWLTNGTLFDQSRADESGNVQPLVFTVGEKKVIPGFEQDMIGMKQGGVRLMIIPPKVGYGSQAQGNIPANSVLIFQVELLAAL